MPRTSTEKHRVLDLAINGKSFGQNHILGPVRLELEPGQRFAITGESGIGKSTLLRIIAGLEQADSGSVVRTQRIAMVFQSPNLLEWRNALDNICIVAGVTAQEARNALDSVGLKEKETLFPRQLSLGQQRRLSLARALASVPDLLLMDEPFASLDQATANRMISLTKDRLEHANLAAIIVTHAHTEAMALKAHRIVTLAGTPAVMQ